MKERKLLLQRLRFLHELTLKIITILLLHSVSKQDIKRENKSEKQPRDAHYWMQPENEQKAQRARVPHVTVHALHLSGLIIHWVISISCKVVIHLLDPKELRAVHEKSTGVDGQPTEGVGQAEEEP